MPVWGLWDIIMPYKNNREYQAAYYKKNQEEIKERHKKRYLENKESVREYNAAYYKKNRENLRINHIKNKYGLSEGDYNNMLHDQKSKCKICDLEFIEGVISNSNKGCVPHIDHCHESGGVRGLLCDNCNKGLGHFKDSKKNLQSAMEYLG